MSLRSKLGKLWARVPGGAKVGAMAAAVLVLYVQYLIERDGPPLPSPPPERDCSHTDCPPPDREETPFLWGGETLESRTDRHANGLRRRYNPVHRRFPDAASCMPDAESFSGDYSDARLDWSAFQTKTEAEVCLFRLFARLGTPDRIEAWLTATGFADRYALESELTAGRRRIPTTLLSMTWDMRDPRARYGRKEPYCGWFRGTTQSYTVTATIAEPDKLLWVTISARGCWSK